MNFIDTKSPVREIQKLLHSKGWMNKNEHIVSVLKAGEGNMNVVLRVHTNQRSFILKQSRPYVEKYQEIPAPVERIEVEYQFYQTLDSTNTNQHLPKVLSYDKTDFLMMQEDLGECEDMIYLYETKKIAPEQVQILTQFAETMHTTTVPYNYPENKKLRRLNHQHIFTLPFEEDNGFSLNAIQEGLQELSLPFKTNGLLKKTISNLGQQYLSSGTHLIHGDYYPGSWLINENKIFVIDPEFSFVGFPEFDLGVMAGHLFMATMETSIINSILSAYTRPINSILVMQLAGVEILRRIIGLAQLPLQRTLQEKAYLLQEARKMVLS